MTLLGSLKHNISRAFGSRAFGLSAAIILAGLWAVPTGAWAQEGGTLDVGGGVLVPVPAENPTSPGTLDPNAGTTQFGGDQGPSSVQGRGSGRTVVGPDGQEVQVYQSTIISDVSYSGEEQMVWFYDAVEVYTGIIPRVRDSLPHLQRHQQASGTNRLTWIGFQPFPDSTRVFLQFGRSPNYTVSEFDDEHGQVLEIVVHNSRLALSNHTRLVDATYFDRAVQYIDAIQRDGTVRVMVWLDGSPEYEVTADSEYLYLDFPGDGE